MIALEWNPAPGVHAICTDRSADLSALHLPAAPRWLQQVHGTAVADLDAEQGVVTADAAISTTAGTVCVVRTADCLPVLFSAVDGSVVGVAHAGWRGLAAGVIENTVAALRRRAPDVPLLAFLGPAISVAHFEVGSEVRDAFLAAGAAAGAAFTAGRSGRWQCDLYLLARQRLAALGVSAVAGGGLCTYGDEARFFSHRRDVQHRRLDSTGRMAALIWRT
jgi:polyphenol oxidase